MVYAFVMLSSGDLASAARDVRGPCKVLHVDPVICAAVVLRLLGGCVCRLFSARRANCD